MKRYLINGLLALVVGNFAASCADHDVDYVPLEQRKTQAYNEAFKELIGGDVDPNQDWGFDGTPVSEIIDASPARALTRADGDGGFSISENNDFTYFNLDKIKEIIYQKFPEGQNAGGQLNDYEFLSKGEITFSFVYAITSGVDEIGYYYYNPSSGIDSRREVALINNIQTDVSSKLLFQYGIATTGYWYTPTINPLLNDGNTCSQIITNTNINGQNQAVNEVRGRTITLRIPVGYRLGFYVKNPDWNGLKMYSNKSLNADGNFYSAVATLSDGTYAVGLEDWIASTGGDFDCNDIVFTINKTNLPEIVNYNKTSVQRWKYKLLAAQGRVFCEDLGTAGVEDLDFNDVVFDARIWATYEFNQTTTESGEKVNDGYTGWKYEADICMLAGGGTIPAKLIFDYNSDERNVHDMFEGKPGMTTMVNTVDDHANVTVTWDNMKANPGAKTYYDINITNIINALIEEDKDKEGGHKITANDIPISVLWASSEDPSEFGSTMQTVGNLHAVEGQVPHKFCLPIGTKWASERRRFEYAYPGFSEWAKNKESNKEFYKSPNNNYIYSDKGNDAQLDKYDIYGEEYAKGKEYWIPVGKSTTTEVTETETVVWANSGLYLDQWATNHYIFENIFAKMDDNAPDNTYSIRIYGTSNKGDAWGAQFLTGHWKNIVKDYGAVRNDSNFDTKGYIEYTNISKNLVSALKYDTGTENNVPWYCDLQGQDFTATKISFVKTVTTTY